MAAVRGSGQDEEIVAIAAWERHRFCDLAIEGCLEFMKIFWTTLVVDGVQMAQKPQRHLRVMADRSIHAHSPTAVVVEKKGIGE